MTLATFTPKPHAHSTDSRVTCQNCDHNYTGRFCSQCSQSADTHRINWHYIWHEIPHSVWHVDKGILFTLKELFTRPGYTIREYLAGKRVQHYRPLALILVLGAVLTFLVTSLHVSMMEETQKAMKEVVGVGAPRPQRLQDTQATINAFTEKYHNLITILLLPLSSLFSLWFFRKKGLNYPELLTANTFLASIGLVLSIGSILLFKAFGGSTAAYSTIQTCATLTGLAYTMWAFAQLFQGRVKPWNAALRAAGASMASMFSIIFISALTLVAYWVYMEVTEPRNKAETQHTTPSVHAHLPKK